ncbi:hypothetical protein [Methylobacterium pseudosasicola]|uniref:hypothetical protein n=1 Tax=Methylobacterium pseudosasicola TaxID=582667 RepID=UPI001ABFE7D6|nr:hypothetical protein [Methylobacterium pseudosasicola]
MRSRPLFYAQPRFVTPIAAAAIAAVTDLCSTCSDPGPSCPKSRVLRPGAPVVIRFSNRCFPTKPVAIWNALDGAGHVQLVGLYLRRAGFARIQGHVLKPEGGPGDPMTAVIGWTIRTGSGAAGRPGDDPTIMGPASAPDQAVPGGARPGNQLP